MMRGLKTDGTPLYKYLLVGICQNKRNMSMSRNIDSLE
ncbi:hypothetical protein A343_1155 [Porphyromonas gingivalis JCVI SC001]|nr:hypothetical protein A343_1155 [Porphyromonas gingivalis JCVI SC001]